MNDLQSAVPVVSAMPDGVGGVWGDEKYLKLVFTRAKGDNGWVVYKCFNSMFPAPKSWKIEEGAWISEPNIDTEVLNSCSSGINVAPTMEWVTEYVQDSSLHNGRDVNGNSTADIWELFIPDTAVIVIPYSADGKIRSSEAQLVKIVGQAEYGWDDDDDYEYEDDDDFDDPIYDDDDDF